MTASIRLKMRRLSLLATCMTTLVIALGVFVRLQDAGLGCPDWPTCYGHILWPQNEAEQQLANQRFTTSHFAIDKAWPEQIHRLFAASLGLIGLVIFILAFRLSNNRLSQRICLSAALSALMLLFIRIAVVMDFIDVMGVMSVMGVDPYRSTIALAWIDPLIVGVGLTILLLVLVRLLSTQEKPLLLATLTLVALVIQGLFGMWTVTLKLWPQVVSLHLLSGMTLAVLFFWLSLLLTKDIQPLPTALKIQIRRLQPLAGLCLFLVFAQILLGGWLTANYAALACPDFPTCQQQWWPANNFRQGFNLTQAIGPNYLGGQMDNAARIAIHISHRLGAIVLTLALLFLYQRLWHIKSTRLRFSVRLSLLLLVVQIALGISNILWHFPIAIAVLHTLFALFLLLSVVLIYYQLRLTPPSKTKTLISNSTDTPHIY